MKLSVLLILAVLFSACFLPASIRSQRALAEQTGTDRQACQGGDDDACTEYVADQTIADHCPLGYSPAGSSILGGMTLLLTGSLTYVSQTCAGEIRQAATTFIACRHGDKASCADVQLTIARGQEEVERSFLAAQWAQAEALQKLAK